MKPYFQSQVYMPFLLAVVKRATAASCATTLTASYPAPIVSDGWTAQLIVQNLNQPRSILFDSNGGLLIVQAGAGIVHLELTDHGTTCLEVSKKTFLINSTALNHGIALSNDGNTLYASSSEAVFSWSYDAKAVTVGDTNQTIVTGMRNDDHTTRTLMMSNKEPGTLVISRGSNSNIDLEAESLSSGHSQIKAYIVSSVTSKSPPYDFTTSGRLLGWGLRNSVGVAEEPLTGGLYSVENSADQVDRDGVDIHQDNPGEEMNYHGFLNSSTEEQGGNYGYPYCFALWSKSIPNVGTLTTGDQFARDPNATINDTFCATERIPPRLTFQAHMAPLDIIFLPNGTEAFVSFHGSWDRTDPVGYKVSSIAFENGSPVAPSNSMTSTTDIFANADNSQCPGSCFRPVGLDLDTKGRIFMSSDSTGEIYVLVKTANMTGTATTPSPTASPSAFSTKKSEAGLRLEAGASAWWLAVIGVFALF